MNEQQGPTSGVTPHLTVLDRRCREAIAFYERAWGAEQAMPPMAAADMPGMAGDDRVMHAHLRLNGGSLMLNDAFPEFTPGDADHQSAPAHTTLHLQVEDADAWFARAAARPGLDLAVPENPPVDPYLTGALPLPPAKG